MSSITPILLLAVFPSFVAIAAVSAHQKPLNQAREFLEAHNEVRAAVGHPPLSWDNKLAWYARRWARSRVFDCQMVHSYGQYGENMFWSLRGHWTPTMVVGSWVDEKLFYDARSNQCTPGQKCGHYTQIVWRSTARVGCARSRCRNDAGFIVVCSYDPPGNFIGESPFDDYKPTIPPSLAPTALSTPH